MAKKNLGRLAGLAALAGAAYMASKGKDKDDAGDQKTSSYTGDTKKVEDKEEPRRQITDYMKKSDGDSKPITEADVVMPEKAAPAALKKPTPPRTSTTAKTDVKPAPKPVAKGKSRLDPGGRSPSLAAMEARKAARDEEARKANINAHRADVLGQNMENRILKNMQDAPTPGMMKKGGAVKKMASGGMTASRRADGIASRGKTKCKMY
jgi:type IV secretory pathway VirB10-like protein